MARSRNSYRSILKGTSIFGGVQVFQILLSLVRGKFVAMFLGPAGMGVSALFQSLLTAITQFASLGLNLAIVKEVAQRKEHTDASALSVVYRVAKRLIIISASIGALFTLCFAPWLSRISFGSEEFTLQFMLLAVAVLFTVMSNGMLSVLQGVHAVRHLARASLTGGIVGLVVGVPLYWLWGTRGIVPAMILLSLSMAGVYWYSAWKVIPRAGRHGKFCWREHMPLIRQLIVLGLLLMSGDLIQSGCNYLTNIFIRHFGNLSDVGLFQAANSITNQYSGVVFTAMSLDYFPRLTAAADDNSEMNGIVNRQFEIVSLMVAPLLSLLIMFAPLAVTILLTQEFVQIIPLIRWITLGVTIKALMFPLGFITFAKDNKKLFFWMEAVGANALTLLLNCGLYLRFGLIGLGYALLIDCIICLTVYTIVNRKLYDFRFTPQSWRRGLIALCVVTACFTATLIPHTVISYAVMALIVACSGAYSFTILRRLFKA